MRVETLPCLKNRMRTVKIKSLPRFRNELTRFLSLSKRPNAYERERFINGLSLRCRDPNADIPGPLQGQDDV